MEESSQALLKQAWELSGFMQKDIVKKGILWIELGCRRAVSWRKQL